VGKGDNTGEQEKTERRNMKGKQVTIAISRNKIKKS
jgi:hypothetical protein